MNRGDRADDISMKACISRCVQRFVITLILFLSAAGLPQAGSAAPAPLILEDLFRIALREAERIHMARESVHIARAVTDQARSELLPQFSAFGAYYQYPDPCDTDPDSYSNVGLRLGQSFTLNGREFISLQMTRRALEKSGEDLDAVIAAYLVDVGNQFFLVIRAEEQIEIEEAEVRRLSRHLDQVTARVRLNDATRTDLLRTKAALSGAESRRNVAIGALAEQRAILRSLVNLPSDFSLSGPTGSGASKPGTSLDGQVAEALESRPELAALELGARIAEDNVRVRKSDRWPVVSWSAQYQDLRPTPTDIRDTQSFSVGVEVSVPLYTGGRTSARIQEAVAERYRFQYQHSQAVKEVILEVQRAYYGLEKALSGLGALEDQVRFATENHLAVSRQFEVGLATVVDLMDANSLMLSSQSSLATMRIDSYLARLALDYATGRLKQSLPELDRFHGNKAIDANAPFRSEPATAQLANSRENR